MKTFKNLVMNCLCLFLLSNLGFSQTVYDDQYSLYFMDIENTTAITKTVNGGHVFVGTARSWYSFSESADFEASLYFAKTDETGYTEWMQGFSPIDSPYGGAAMQAVTIDQMPDGGFLIAGDVSYYNGPSQVFFLKIDQYGFHEWYKEYECHDEYINLAIQYCGEWHLKDIDITEEGEIAAIGTITEYSGKQKTLVLKADSYGNVSKAASYTFSNENSMDRGVAIKATENGFFALVESFQFTGNNEYSQPLLIKLDNQLNDLWSVLYSDHSPNPAIMKITPIDLEVNGHGEAIILGIRNPEFSLSLNQFVLISVDSNGRHLWDNTLFIHKEDHDSGFLCGNLESDLSGNLYIGFGQETSIEWQTEDMMILESIAGVGVIKTNRGGAPQWYRLMAHGDDFAGFYDMTVANVNGDPTVGIAGSKGSGYATAWVSRLSGKNGENDCTGENRVVYSTNIEYKALGSVLQKETHSIVEIADLVPFSYSMGFYQTRCGEYQQEQWLQSDANNNALQTTPQNTSQANVLLESGIAPNPNNGQFSLTTSLILDGTPALARIFDLTGKLLKEQSIHGTKQIFDLSDLPKGQYLIRVQNGSQHEQHKVIIQD